MPRRLAVVLAIVALLVSFGPASSFALAAGPGAKPDKCAQGNNNTPEKLLPCIRTDDLWQYMKEFQAIADANPGRMATRLATPASQAIRPLLTMSRHDDARLDTTSRSRHTSSTTPPTTALPTMSEKSPIAHDYTIVTEWNPGPING